MGKLINFVYNWSYNRGYIDSFFKTSLIESIRRLAKQTTFFDKRIIDGITNGVGITSFFVGEVTKYIVEVASLLICSYICPMY